MLLSYSMLSVEETQLQKKWKHGQTGKAMLSWDLLPRVPKVGLASDKVFGFCSHCNRKVAEEF